MKLGSTSGMLVFRSYECEKNPHILKMDWCDMLFQSLTLITLRGSLVPSQLSAIDDALFAQSVICNTTNIMR